MIAKESGRFFWDVDPGFLDLDRHKTFIIERLLELGDETAIRWLFATYHKKDIVAVFRASRSLSPKSRNFWRIRLDDLDHD
jgi:hypothetical protein